VRDYATRKNKQREIAGKRARARERERESKSERAIERATHIYTQKEEKKFPEREKDNKRQTKRE